MKGRYNGRASAMSLKIYKSNCLRQISPPVNKNPRLAPMSNSSHNPITDSTKSGPISDPELPDCYVIKRCSNFIPESIQLEELPPLEGSCFRDFISLFMKKVELCSQICNFDFVNVDKEAKGIKTKTLIELKNTLGQMDISSLLGFQEITYLIEMFRKNIVRNMPSIPLYILQNSGVKAFVEPAWPHLSLVYEIMSIFSHNYKTKFHLPITFLKDLIFFINSPDKRERDFIQDFLQNYMNDFPQNAEVIYKQLTNRLIEFNERVGNAFGVNPILTLFNSNLYFSFSYLVPYKVVLAPLLSSTVTSNCFGLILAILAYIMEENYQLSFEIMTYMIRTFPITPARSQIVRLTMLNSVIIKANNVLLKQIIVPFFTLYSKCAMNMHPKVAIASFQIWNIPQIDRIVAVNPTFIFTKMYGAISYAMQNHWEQKVKGASLIALKSMKNLNSKVFESVHKIGITQKTQTIQNWSTVIRIASSKSPDINSSRTIAETEQFFGQIQKQIDEEIAPPRVHPRNIENYYYY